MGEKKKKTYTFFFPGGSYLNPFLIAQCILSTFYHTKEKSFQIDLVMLQKWWDFFFFWKNKKNDLMFI